MHKNERKQRQSGRFMIHETDHVFAEYRRKQYEQQDIQRNTPSKLFHGSLSFDVGSGSRHEAPLPIPAAKEIILGKA